MPTSELPDPSAVLAKYHSISFGAPPLALWLNGIFACLMACTLWVTVKRSDASNTRKLSWISVLLTLYISAAIHSMLALGWEMDSVVNHATSIADELKALGKPPRWYIILGTSMELLSICVGDCLSIWRCWIVWGKRPIFVVFPSLACIAGNVFGIFTIVGAANNATGFKLAKSSATPYYSLALATTLYCTILIVIRILMVQYAFDKGINRRTVQAHYAGALEIIVESSMFYSAIFVAMMILVAQKSPGQSWPVSILPQIAGIFPTLMLFRVVAGVARPDSSWMSSIDFRRTFASTTGIENAPESFSATSLAGIRNPKSATASSAHDPYLSSSTTTVALYGAELPLEV